MKNRKAQEQRRQKKQAKQKNGRDARLASRRRELERARIRQKKLWTLRSLAQGGETLSPLGDDDYVYWLCHGVNYIASDHATGVWSPLFEEIYHGTLPQPEAIAERVMTAYSEELKAAGAFSGIPRAVLAWSVMERSIITIYKHEAVRQLKAKDPECDAELLARAPHNSTVWALMDKVKQRSLIVGSEMDAETTTADTEVSSS